MNRLFRTFLALALACAATITLLNITSADQTLDSTFLVSQRRIHIPAAHFQVGGNSSRRILLLRVRIQLDSWTTEVITLNPDGSSAYAYYPPYSATVTGTWVYTPSREVVGFTNFRWLTTTFQPPNHLWASQYLTQAGFEIAVSLLQQTPIISPTRYQKQKERT